jgi:hypothetical protein
MSLPIARGHRAEQVPIVDSNRVLDETRASVQP